MPNNPNSDDPGEKEYAVVDVFGPVEDTGEVKDIFSREPGGAISPVAETTVAQVLSLGSGVIVVRGAAILLGSPVVI